MVPLPWSIFSATKLAPQTYIKWEASELRASDHSVREWVSTRRRNTLTLIKKRLHALATRCKISRMRIKHLSQCIIETSTIYPVLHHANKCSRASNKPCKLISFGGNYSVLYNAKSSHNLLNGSSVVYFTYTTVLKNERVGIIAINKVTWKWAACLGVRVASESTQFPAGIESTRWIRPAATCRGGILHEDLPPLPLAADGSRPRLRCRHNTGWQEHAAKA
jgi:hypothetical protein